MGGIWNGLEALKCSIKIRRLTNWGSKVMIYLPACLVSSQMKSTMILSSGSIHSWLGLSLFPVLVTTRIIAFLGSGIPTKKQLHLPFGVLGRGEGYPNNYTSWCFTMIFQSKIIAHYSKRWCFNPNSWQATHGNTSLSWGLSTLRNAVCPRNVPQQQQLRKQREAPRVYRCAWLKKREGCARAGCKQHQLAS